MFAPAILPFQITLCVGFFLVVGAIVFLPRFGYRRRSVAGIAAVGAIVLFIPSCFGISLIVDFFRYGTFHYAGAAEIPERHIRFPASATDITVFKYASGHDARFSISKGDLLAWIESFRGRKDLKFAKAFGHRCYQRGWPAYDDLEQYDGPYAANGAGFSAWRPRLGRPGCTPRRRAPPPPRGSAVARGAQVPPRAP